MNHCHWIYIDEAPDLALFLKLGLLHSFGDVDGLDEPVQDVGPELGRGVEDVAVLENGNRHF